jgi:hypothetical protein
VARQLDNCTFGAQNDQVPGTCLNEDGACDHVKGIHVCDHDRHCHLGCKAPGYEPIKRKGRYRGEHRK